MSLPVWRRMRPGFLILLALLLGLALRGYHYLRGPSLWHDEAVLVLNVVDRGYAELLGPLYGAEAAPPGFLWLERTVCLLLGDSLLGLRLPAFLASCLALLLVAVVARRLWPGPAGAIPVLLFAASDRLLWHSCEAKPYALDACVAAGLIVLFLAFQGWPLVRQLLLYAALAPLLIFLVYPGTFLVGGVLVALLPAVWKQRRDWKVGLAYVLSGAVVGASFLVLLLGPIRAQRCGPMDSCWVTHFPPWDQPWRLPLWTMFSTLDVGYYCFRPVGHLLTLLAAVGAVVLWVRGRRPLVLMLVTPALLVLVASGLHAYPYGGSRVEVFLAPAICVLATCGLVELVRRVPTRVAAAGVSVLLAAPVVLCGAGVLNPWDRADCEGAAEYVLARRAPEDDVRANHWEYEYYFRHLGGEFQTLPEHPDLRADRAWVVLSGTTEPERLALMRLLTPPTFRPVHHEEFRHTSVFLLSRTGGQDRWPVARAAVD